MAQIRGGIVKYGQQKKKKNKRERRKKRGKKERKNNDLLTEAANTSLWKNWAHEWGVPF
jgi:hypothetical protein